MKIVSLSQEQVHCIRDCYLGVWHSLKGILPDEYVETQIKQASSKEFHEKLSEAVTDTRNIMMMTTEKNETIGIAWGRIQDDGSSWLAFIGVLPDNRQMGVGASLLAEFINESRRKGAKKISLNTDPRLIPAVNLYETRGFHVGGTTKNKYGLELIIYSKEI